MFFKKKEAKKSYDKENKKPVIRASICNGEQVQVFRIFIPEPLRK